MIEARFTLPSRGLADRLAERARVLAEARAASRFRSPRRDGSHWRSAALLWPLFAKDR